MTERLNNNSNMISKSIHVAANAWFCIFNLWLSFLKVLSGANIDTGTPMITFEFCPLPRG